VLEEDDPGRDLVRPCDPLGLLFVLPEVPRGVEELLGDDRRAEPDVVERELPPRRLRDLAAFEVVPHRRYVELDHAIASELADPPVVEGHELHDAIPQIRCAASAYTCA